MSKSLIDSLLERRAALRSELDALLIEDRELSVEEDARADAILADIKKLDARVEEIHAAETRAAKVAKVEAVTATGDVTEERAGKPAYDEVARVGAEKRTYSPDNGREGFSFLADVAAAQVQGNADAAQRLSRHMQEERVEYGAKGIQLRDVGTTAFGALTVPQYLTDLYAPAARAMAPLAENCRRLPLPPDGMSVIISRITTASTTAVQATQNATVSETDMADTTLTVPVNTIAGSQDVAFQAVQRTTGLENVVVSDLLADYYTRLDDQIINGSGTSGQHRGIRNISGISTVTYTDTTPTGIEGYGPLWNIQANIEGAVFKRATHFVMAPRRFNWFASTVSTNQSLVGFNGGTNLEIGQANTSPYGSGVRGLLAGLPVIVDGNIPTNISSDQDTILAVNANELFLWEQPGSPVYIRAEQPLVQNLAVRYVVYGFSAFTGGRYPAAHGAITGTGLGGTLTYGIAAS